MSSSELAIEFDPKKIDAVFAELDQCHLPGAAVGIAIGGRPVYRKGFGLASMELPVLLSPAMRMRIGSTTKHFAALAYLLLCEEGKAGIDDPIGKYLPELHPVTHRVTMRQLMGHLGGLRDVFDISFQFSGIGRSVSSTDLLSLYRDIDDFNAAPGTTWIYNNGGYLMLSFAIERITGRTLEDVFRERIFEPVGMYDTMLRRFDTDFVPNSAALHMPTAAGGFEKSYMGTALTGEGGIVSTVDDMLRWLAHMDDPVVGSVATWAALKEPQMLANGTGTGYGLGLMSQHYRGVPTIRHAGGVLAGNSEMLKVPAAGLDIAIMVNRGDVFALLLAEKILDACLPGLAAVKNASSSAFVTGTFHSPVTGRVIQLFEREGQQIASIDAMDMPVEPDDSGLLWPSGIWEYLKQSLSLTGTPASPTSIRFSDFGNVDAMVPSQLLTAPEVSSIVGAYCSDITGTEGTIRETNDGPRLRTTGRFGSVEYRLESLADGIWRAKPTGATFLGGVVSFDSDSAAFRFSTFRTRALIFRRCA